MESSAFEQMYASTPPWEIGRPQQDFVRLAQEGAIIGSVLDVGCGTGENALYLAGLGHEVWGIDYVRVAIERAQQKARERKPNARFQEGNALELERLGRMFDTVIDCGLFHTFDDEQRAQ